jgi:1,4-alpha-glucan branching enzyme
MKTVEFRFHTGLRQPLFKNVTLVGSWDTGGAFSAQWSSSAMAPGKEADGTWSFSAAIDLLDAAVGTSFAWGVRVDGPSGNGVWAIAAEVNDAQNSDCVRQFVLAATNEKREYHLTHLSRLGANIEGAANSKKTRFSVWAPHAQKVELVLGNPTVGYIADNGDGITAIHAMRAVGGGVWEATVYLPSVDNTVYMYRIVRDSGDTVYRTDLYSRCQAGSGTQDPKGGPFAGQAIDLDGRVSCSYVMNPTKVESPIRSNRYLSDTEFWQDELDPARPLPTRLQDLSIYELHIGALGFGQPRPGNIEDAIALIPYLEDLGVNAVELLPLQEFSGTAGWGYGATHFCAIEFSSGGPDHLKAFVKACHRRGIAVLLDVVYNHYPSEADRAEWMYDTNSHERNAYYWYEGKPADYPIPEGGYLDNESSGWAPGIGDEMVRKLFTSSAVAMLLDFHIDGFRVDQTTSLHAYAKLHADGAAADRARIFGAKFLREWVRTMQLVKPGAFLIAEDHSGWEAVTRTTASGGIGFNATWFNDFYHHLIGDTQRVPNLLASAGYGGDWGLAMTFFGRLLQATSPSKIVFPETHDECGNSENHGVRSARTILVAVNKADPTQLDSALRPWAEARCRTVAGLTFLSAGIPMFFMGECVGAANPYRHDNWLAHREDLWGLRRGSGANLFRFYNAILSLRRRFPALREANLEVLHTHDDNRVIAFKRWGTNSEALMLASLNNAPFASGYTIAHDHLPDAQWREVFNSDATEYGGHGIGNCSATIPSQWGRFSAVIPANGFVVFERL